nr:MAG TPA: hypothetical protein [Caudoviricetes sp.]
MINRCRRRNRTSDLLVMSQLRYLCATLRYKKMHKNAILKTKICIKNEYSK